MSVLTDIDVLSGPFVYIWEEQDAFYCQTDTSKVYTINLKLSLAWNKSSWRREHNIWSGFGQGPHAGILTRKTKPKNLLMLTLDWNIQQSSHCQMFYMIYFSSYFSVKQPWAIDNPTKCRSLNESAFVVNEFNKYNKNHFSSEVLQRKRHSMKAWRHICTENK